MEAGPRYGIPYIDIAIEEEHAEAGCSELLKKLRPRWPSSDVQTKVG